MEEYDSWNGIKKSLVNVNEKLLFNEGEIWWCSLGLNIGTETRGSGKMFRRPVIIIKKLSADACIILPVTTQESLGTWFFPLEFPTGRQWAMLHQIRMVNVKRFQKKAFVLNTYQLRDIKEKIKQLLDLSDNHPDAIASEIGGLAPQDELTKELYKKQNPGQDHI